MTALDVLVHTRFVVLFSIVM